MENDRFVECEVSSPLVVRQIAWYLSTRNTEVNKSGDELPLSVLSITSAVYQQHPLP